MVTKRAPGYYWVQPDEGGEWLVGYWYQGPEDETGERSSGYFDCSNHWSENDLLPSPFQVGPRIQPHDQTPFDPVTEGNPVKRDLLASVGANASPLEQAAKHLLREALDRVELPPCDHGDDAVAAKQLTPEMQALLKALTEHNKI